MNRKRISLVLAVAAVLVLSTLCWLPPWSRTSQAAPAPSGEATFKGKVLLVSTNHLSATFLLEKAQVQKIADRSFLVGKGASSGKMADWYKGRTVRLQLEHIESITEFDDVKEAKKALESGAGSPFGGGVQVVPAEAGVPLAPPAVAPVPAGAPLPPAVKP